MEMFGDNRGPGRTSPVLAVIVGIVIMVICVVVLFTSGMTNDLKVAVSGFEKEAVSGEILDKHTGNTTKKMGAVEERSTFYTYRYAYENENYEGSMDVFNTTFEVGDTLNIKVGKADRAYSKEENQKIGEQIVLPLILVGITFMGFIIFIIGASNLLKIIGVVLALTAIGAQKLRGRNKD